MNRQNEQESTTWVICEMCGTETRPVWFIESEWDGGVRTGRKRRNISHLECPVCGKRYTIDDSFAGAWH